MLASLCCSIRAEDMIPVTEFYRYEKARPLSEKVELLKETDAFTQYDVRYSGAWGSSVTAYLMVPKNGVAPYPCIIFGHGFTGSRDDIEFAYDGFARSGIAVFSIDFWYHGDRKVQGVEMYSQHLSRMRDGLIGSAVDLSRGFDFLEARSDIDGARIGYVGGSMGGIIGALFAGSERRVKAPVLVVGGGDWSYLISHSVVTQAVLSSKYSDMKEFSRRAREELAPADPVNIVGNISPRPLLMLNAKNDVLVPPVAAKRMFLTAREPKKLVWYSSGHEIPKDQIIPVIEEWADKYLKNDEIPDFTSVVQGYKTSAIKVDEEKHVESPAAEVPLNSLFSYNKDIPLFSDRLPGSEEVPGAESISIRFTSIHEKIVSGNLFLPEVGAAPYACVIMVNDAGESAAAFMPLVHLLVRNGIAAAVIDAMMMNDEKEPVKPYGIAGLETRIVQSVADTQRLMDLLDKFGDIQAGKYILFGEGAGGIVTTVVSSLDGRAKQLILLNVGGGYDAEAIPLAVFNEKAQRTVGEESAIIDPSRYMKKIHNTSVLIATNGANKFSRQAVENLYSSGNEPKEMLEIDADDNAPTAALMKGIMRFIRDHWNEEEASSSQTVGNGIGWKEVHADGIVRKALDIIVSSQNSPDGINTIRVQVDMGDVAGGGDEEATQEHTISAYIQDGTESILLRDNGKSPDKTANDGKYTGVLISKDSSARKVVCIGGLSRTGESIEEKRVEVIAGQ